MKITIETKLVEEIEIDLPFYAEHGSSLYKVTETETIEVTDTPEGKGIKVGRLCYTDLVIKSGRQITEQKYHEAYFNVLNFLISHSTTPELYGREIKEVANEL